MFVLGSLFNTYLIYHGHDAKADAMRAQSDVCKLFA